MATEKWRDANIQDMSEFGTWRAGLVFQRLPCPVSSTTPSPSVVTFAAIAATTSRPRSHVEEVLREMDYVPHWAGRALASRRSRTVGAIVPTLDIAIFACGIEAMEARLQQFGYSLLIASSGYDKVKELSLVRTFIERGLDAIALVGADHDTELYRMLEAARVPVVNTYIYDPAADVPCVGVDHRQAARRILRHLLDLGHCQFGFVTTSPRKSDRTKARLDGMLTEYPVLEIRMNNVGSLRSCSDLFRASRRTGQDRGALVDGRDKPGHDVKGTLVLFVMSSGTRH